MLSSGPVSLGASFEIIKGDLRLIDEFSNRVRSGDFPNLLGSGCVKGYVKCKLVFAARLHLASPSRDFHFISYRIPRKARNGKVSSLAPEGPKYSTDHFAAYFDTDRVFAVCERRHGANKGIPHRIRTVSRVWLLPSDGLPKFFRDIFGTRFFVPQLPIVEVTDIPGPRVMPIFNGLADSLAGSENYLVKSVPAVVDSVRETFLDQVRKRSDHLDFFDRISRVRIDLADAGERFWLEETLSGRIRFSPGAYCPVNQLLRALECI